MLCCLLPVVNTGSVFGADIDVVNKTSIDAGDFPLRADIENNVIFLRGKFLSRTVTGEKIIGDVTLDVVLQDIDGRELSRVTVPVKEYRMGLWFEQSVGTVVPREGGISREALRRIIVTAREFDTEVKEAGRREASIRAKGWPKGIETAVIERRVLIGMTREQVRLSFGAPKRIDETIRASGRTEYWNYGSLGLLFEGDHLTTIHRSR
jgi:hypothetical protein